MPSISTERDRGSRPFVQHRLHPVPVSVSHSLYPQTYRVLENGDWRIVFHYPQPPPERKPSNGLGAAPP
ncbi:hypothetical protein Cob_v004811 [Colletotrichum orbiculare MAFF 240422]|uniref:Uncharacterized protein n=1 Tax=Colletotrichum orbiculare (strain 104-T / ATCC 96160 / CBS 514.97 / LARS 414 / MAFF 240422) TaxID=1213857 RepID=A0A484FW43_COLOR|nr:hypothetical protein Cob_v004811 [Colletotrichum orbiculare MAFF 240422]